MRSLKKTISRLGTKRQIYRCLRNLGRKLFRVLEFLLILTGVICLLLAIINIENTLEENTDWGKYFFQSLENSRIIGTLESISIITALVVYLRRGRKRSHYEAWQVIDAAQGLEISHARIKALEELAKDGISLKGLSLPKANLEQITLVDINLKEANLQGAKLIEANLKGSKFELAQLQKANLWAANLEEAFFLLAQLQKANLCSANLKNADMEGVNLLEADLQKANLQGAYILGNLQSANFQNANLKWANLQGAYLKNANFKGSNLQCANLKEANLEGVSFANANLHGTNLQNAKGIHPAQVMEAKHWKLAKYSQELGLELGLPEFRGKATENG
jgi:uncharacterized protein YjbI with pentapeptide repeats